MPQPRFQLSINDQFGAPGVYIKELAVTAPLRGVFFGVTGIVGQTVRGPMNTAVRCDSYQRFLDVFGGRDYGINGGSIVSDVWWALQQKQFGTVYVVRVTAAAATNASYTARTAAAGGGVNILQINAASGGVNSNGAWGNNVAWKVLNASDGNANHFNLSIKLFDRTYLFENLDVSADVTGGANNLSQVIGADFATVITCTKLATGRPVNSTANTDGADANGYIFLGAVNAGYTSTAGSDGSVADTDYTSTGGPMDTLQATRAIDTKFVANRSNSNIKVKIFALGPNANTSLWLMRNTNVTDTDVTAEADVPSYRDRHIVYCYNDPYYIDPVTGGLTAGESITQMAADLSQITPDVHPGVVDVAPLHNGIVQLQFALTDAQRDALDAAGISFLNNDVDPNNNPVLLWGNGRTTDLTINNSQIDGQRSKYFIIMGLAQRMRGDEKKPNTAQARAKRKAAFAGWLTELAEAQRFVASDPVSNAPLFDIKNDAEVNTPADWAAGIQRDLVRVQLIPKSLYLQLQIQIGTVVQISQV